MSVFQELGRQSPRTAPDGLWFRYRMRWKRRRLLMRSLRRRKELSRVSVDEQAISDASILGFATVRNEMERLPHFLNHHRALGVGHFLIVDNDSDDGTGEFLAAQADVSLWNTKAGYKASRFGVDWLTCLQFRFAPGKWALTLDADELLVLPGPQSLKVLTDRLEQEGWESFGAVMLDMYPKGPVNHAPKGKTPLDSLRWLDPEGYRAQHHRIFDNLWIQGGPRDRLFFGAQPDRAPTLNKTPLVKWRRAYAYVTSTHQMLPRRLNRVFDAGRPTGVLLHTKFLPSIGEKSAEELERRQHFENSAHYEDYHAALIEGPDFWHAGSVEYEGPEQLLSVGLMSNGD